jgi:hypothetical protein
LSENLKGRDNLEELDVDDKIYLNASQRRTCEEGVRMWARFI